MWKEDWRDRGWSQVDQAWDIVIVGGGIVGASILREAARLGWRALLVEQRDFAWGASSRSSKLIHGGLRYLKAGQFQIARDSARQREHLVKGKAYLQTIRAICQPELGWTDEHWEQEEQTYLELLQKSYSLPDHSTIPDWQALLKAGQTKKRLFPISAGNVKKT